MILCVIYLSVVETVPAKWTAARIRAFKPPEQTCGVEIVLACDALLGRRLHVRPNNAVADGTLTLPLQNPLHISLERHQAFDEASRGKDDDLECAYPGLPVLL